MARPVPLPEDPPALRRRRRSGAPRLLWIHRGLVVVTTVALPVLTWTAGRAMLGSTAGSVHTASGVGVYRDHLVEAEPTVLVVHRTAGGDLGTVAVAAELAGGRGGHVVLIPTGLAAGPGGEGPTLAELWASGGTTAVAEAVAGLLGVRFGGVATVTDGDLAGLTGGEPVTVRLVEPVIVDGRTLHPRGTRIVPPAGVGPLMAARSDNETEIAALARTADVVAALLGSLPAPPATSSPPDGDGTAVDLRSVLGRIADGPRAVEILPVEPAGDGRYRLRAEEAAELVGTVMPGSVDPTGRFRVRVVDATGRAVPRVAAAVIGAGGVVTFVGTTPPELDGPRVIVHQPAVRDAAVTLATRLGVPLDDVTDGGPDPSVDVTVITPPAPGLAP